MADKLTVWDSSTDPIDDLRAGIAAIENAAPYAPGPAPVPQWVFDAAEKLGYDMTQFVVIRPIEIPEG